jgi:hypothetical protein
MMLIGLYGPPRRMIRNPAYMADEVAGAGSVKVIGILMLPGAEIGLTGIWSMIAVFLADDLVGRMNCCTVCHWGGGSDAAGFIRGTNETPE